MVKKKEIAKGISKGIGKAFTSMKRKVQSKKKSFTWRK